MTYEEALHAAKMGHKVSPAGRKFFVYYLNDIGFRRVSMSEFFLYSNEEFIPTMYEKMMTWQIYKKDPGAKLKALCARIFGKFYSQPSSNPS